MSTALRPMSTGQILDRTFALYRKNFKLFAGIAAIPGAFYFLFNLLVLLVQTATGSTNPSRTGIVAIAVASVSVLVGIIAYLISLAVSQAATVFGVSDAHLEKPTSIRECYARVKGHYGRMVNVIASVYLRVFGVIILSYLVLIGLVLIPGALGAAPNPIFAAIGGLVFLVGFFVGLFIAIRLFARYSLAVPACALEDIKARAAMKRSVFLTKGSVGKILAIYILVIVLTLGITFAVTIPLSGLIAVAKTTLMRTLFSILGLIASFIVTVIVGPLGTVALSLVYYDERVRKEAFDIQYLMEAASGGVTPVLPEGQATGAATGNA